MDSDEDLDTHICLKCQRTIVGLDNYVAHKRRECPILLVLRARQPTRQDEVTEIQHDSQQHHPAIPHVDTISPTIFETSPTVSASHPAQDTVVNKLINSEDSNLRLSERSKGHEVDVEDQQQQASTNRPEDAFFLSLELQSANRPMPQPCRLLTNLDDAVSSQPPLQEEAAATTLIPYTSDDVAVLDAFKVVADAFKVVADDHIYETEDEDDDYPGVPPRGHTGGKWRPASAAGDSPLSPIVLPSSPCVAPAVSTPAHDISPSHRYNTRKVDTRFAKCSRCLNVHPPFSRHCHRSSISSSVTAKLTGRAKRRLVCRACSHLAFVTISALLDHLCSPACRGWSSPNDSADRRSHVALLLRHSTRLAPLAPFCCTLCRFYFNRPEQLLEHWTSPSKYHDESRDTGGSFICSHCTDTFLDSVQLGLHLSTLFSSLDCRQLRRLTPLVTDAAHANSASALVERHYTPDDQNSSDCARTNIDGGKRSIRDKMHSNLTPPGCGNHKKHGTGRRSWKCRLCTLKYQHRSALLDHVASSHPDRLQCSLCCVTFISPADLIRHMGTVAHQCHRLVNSAIESLPSLCCEQCSFVTRSPSALVFHQVVVHVGAVTSDGLDDVHDAQTNESTRELISPLYRCPQCTQSDGCSSDGVSFELFALRLHLAEHANEVPTHHCAFCRLVFDDEQELRGHDRSQHGCKNLVCEHCDYRTDRSSKLAEHANVHRLERSRCFLCDTCAASFFSSTCLRAHMKKHSKERSHRCTFKECTRAFRFASELVEHARVHRPEKPFLCDYCGYSSKTRAQLQIHRRQHTLDKRFRCPQPQCDYAATKSAHLRRHLLIHSGAKPYRCAHCAYTCNTQENLRKHVLKSKKHAGLRVYPCPHCTFGSDLANEMRQHLADVHGITPATDVDCAFASRQTGIYRPGDEAKQASRIEYVPRAASNKTNRTRTRTVKSTRKAKKRQASANQKDTTVSAESPNPPNHQRNVDVSTMESEMTVVQDVDANGNSTVLIVSQIPEGGATDTINRSLENETNGIDGVISSFNFDKPENNHQTLAGDGDVEVGLSSRVTTSLNEVADVVQSSFSGTDSFEVSANNDNETTFTVVDGCELLRFVHDEGQGEIVFTVQLPTMPGLSSGDAQLVRLLEIVPEVNGDVALHVTRPEVENG